MIFRRTPQFQIDYNRLEKSDQKIVQKEFPSISEALQGNVGLYRHYRIQAMQGKSNIMEGHLKDNLCFTFHYEYSDSGEKICFFRRIGTHKIYKKP